MDERSSPELPRTERHDAPLYLARYQERRARRAPEPGNGERGAAGDGQGEPLYLRRFRERRSGGAIDAPPPPWQDRDLGFQQALSEDNRNKEIAAPPAARPRISNEVYLVRHAETQGYSTESGLTPLGTWQAHTYGHTLAKRIRSGERVVIACAPTNRAGQTAENLNRGLLDGLVMFDKDVDVAGPEPMEEFRNFRVATPEGFRDVTAAFRKYYSILEEFERTALGDRPMWLVEVDRFWRTQLGGGDPIQHWLTVPMLHFEPPALVVRRFWAGLRGLAAREPGARLVIATHSGPIRAFAIWALGYDPGEPYNTEHVRVKLMEGGREALVSYRNRVQEIHVPAPEDMPDWTTRVAIQGTVEKTIRQPVGARSRAVPDFIVWFDRYQESDHGRVGGKNASLGTMMAAGLPVPPGFAITTEAYRSLTEHPDIGPDVQGLLGRVDPDDPRGLEEISKQIRATIEAATLPPELVEQVRAAYAELCDRCDVADLPVAVRSSATAEDLPDASFAGEHDTFLWVRGADAVLDRMRGCWSSIFTARAISYRHEMNRDHDGISMSVGVQKMVLPRASGVAFTLNPTNGDRSTVAIDASWGLGEAVVAGEVNPDNFLVDKVLFEITRRAVSCKTIEYRVTNGDSVERADVEPERQMLPCLADEEIKAVARMARRAEKHYGHPQDIEWAIDRDLPDGENVILLQARPETVWSRRTREPIARATGMESIVSTLVAPLNTRPSDLKEETADEP